MKRAEFHPEALVELDEIAVYLREQRVGLDERFADAFDVAMKRAFKRPGGGRPTFRGCRLTEVPRFPHRVIYKERSDDLWILAIAHVRRRPGYWTGRIE